MFSVGKMLKVIFCAYQHQLNSPWLEENVSKMIQTKPSDRPNVDQILKDPIFREPKHITLTNFENTHGRAESIRMLMNHLCLPFEDKRVPLAQLDRMKSPILNHGPVTVLRVETILKYVGVLYGLYPTKKAHEIDLLFEQFAKAAIKTKLDP